MIKKILVACALLAMGAALFCQTTDSRKGYFDLPWGSTVEDAKKAGYKLTKIPQSTEVQNLWTDVVDLYSVKSKDSLVKSLFFLYYKGKLFEVQETVKLPNIQSKIESRYGNFAKNGIRNKGTSYGDNKTDENNKILSLSIVIIPKGSVLDVGMYDWKNEKELRKSFKELAANASGVDSEGLVAALKQLANKLVNSGDDKVSTYAILKLSSDFNNAQYDEYITDILTEAIFNTGSVKIIERGNLEKIIKEQKLQASGLIDERTAKDVGKVSGADYVCYGSIKDIGQKFTISARVVDVETGEICAMSRDTIEKDEYLLSLASGGSASAASVPSRPSSPNRASGASVKTAWTVTKNRNDFDGYTTYTFVSKSSGEEFLFLGYDKYENPTYSIVRAGSAGWPDFAITSPAGIYEFKTDNGTIVSKNYGHSRKNVCYGKWSKNTGWKKGSNQFTFMYDRTESAIFWINLFEENNSVTIRYSNKFVCKFDTQGFWDAVKQAGLTKEEIMNAISNDSF